MFLSSISTPAAPLDPSGFALLAQELDTQHAVWIDTTTGTLLLEEDGTIFQGEQVDEVVVFAFGAISIGGDVEITGSSAAALLSSGDLTIGRQVLASASGQAPGPGGWAGVGCGDGEGPGAGVGDDEGGGGAGHAGAGGSARASAGGATYGDPRAQLSGGSSGGAGGDQLLGCSLNVFSGGGGGAVELGAGGVLTVKGPILAFGGAGNSFGGGGGGGAGGMVLLHALGGGSCNSIDVSGGRGGNGQQALGGPGGGGGGGGYAMLSGISGCTVDVSGGEAGDDSLEDGHTGEILFDGDGDGALFEDDCDDAEPSVFPGAAEIPCDDIDQDCDPTTTDCPADAADTDTTVPSAQLPPRWFCGHTPGTPPVGVLALAALLARRRRC